MVLGPRPPPIEASTSAANPVLVLMLKRAVPGYGKQRLAHEIGQQNALLIAEALLDCALEDAANWNGELAFAISKEDERSWAEQLSEKGEFENRAIQILCQCSGNLGARLQDLDARLRIDTHRKILLMAGDAPGLLPEHFQQSITALNDRDVTLVNSTDGGTDLMGSRIGWPAMSHLPWGTAGLGDALATFCEQHSMRIRRISGSFDIDTRSDLAYAKRELGSDTRLARGNLLQQIERLQIA